MRTRPTYTEEFRADAIELLERTNRSLPEVANDLGVTPWSLRSWYKKAQMAKRKPKPPSRQSARSGEPSPSDGSLEDQNTQLRRELKRAQKRIADLEMDREILKKAAAFFVKESE